MVLGAQKRKERIWLLKPGHRVKDGWPLPKGKAWVPFSGEGSPEEAWLLPARPGEPPWPVDKAVSCSCQAHTDFRDFGLVKEIVAVLTVSNVRRTRKAYRTEPLPH